jgi:putative membrane protein
VACFGGAALAAGAALVPPVSSHDERFPVHVAQHLLLGLVAPACLALAAPMTLAAIAAGPRRRHLFRLLHSRFLRTLLHPLVAAPLAIAPMYALYLTPLYAETLTQPLLHEAVHVHFAAAGFLFAASVIGVDPIPRRPSLRLRGAVLFVSLSAHAVLAKLLYAAGPGVAGLPAGGVGDWRRGAELMWYGGDLVDVLLVVALFAEWRRVSISSERRARMRATPASICAP